MNRQLSQVALNHKQSLDVTTCAKYYTVVDLVKCYIESVHGIYLSLLTNALLASPPLTTNSGSYSVLYNLAFCITGHILTIVL